MGGGSDVSVFFFLGLKASKPTSTTWKLAYCITNTLKLQCWAIYPSEKYLHEFEIHLFHAKYYKYINIFMYLILIR